MLTGFLEKVREKKVEEIKRLKSKKFKFKKSKFKAGSLSSKIKLCDDVPIIAEIKRGSPSSGIIRNKIFVSHLASEFERAGACGISVITDSNFFFSDIDYLHKLEKVTLPILRKDFILDPVQIEETASTCASSVLLIVRFVKDEQILKELVDCSFSLEIEPVIEVFDEKDLEKAKKVNSNLILINNRDLLNFKVDLRRSVELIKYKENHEIWISGSGLKSPIEIKELRSVGFDAFLVGTSIMKSSSPYRFIKFLKGKDKEF